MRGRTQNYIIGNLSSSTSFINMYLFGSFVVFCFRILFTMLSAEEISNTAANLLQLYLSTLIPWPGLFLINGPLEGFFILTSNAVLGAIIAGARYELNT